MQRGIGSCELYITRVQTMRPGVPDNQNEHTTRWNKIQHCRRHVDITAGVMTRSLSVVSGEHAGYDTTLTATQVGPRSDKACLGGRDDGASECQKLVDLGVKTGLLASSTRL